MNKSIKEVINENANVWTCSGIICTILGAAMAGVAALVALATGGFEAMKDMF